jgi:hypothetical protein
MAVLAAVEEEVVMHIMAAQEILQRQHLLQTQMQHKVTMAG